MRQRRQDVAPREIRPEIRQKHWRKLDLNVAERVDVTTITHVVLTHLRFDHVGVSRCCPSRSPVLRAASRVGTANDAAAVKGNGYFPIDYGEPARQVIRIDGNHEVFGDGSITLMRTLAIRPGISLFVRPG